MQVKVTRLKQSNKNHCMVSNFRIAIVALIISLCFLNLAHAENKSITAEPSVTKDCKVSFKVNNSDEDIYVKEGEKFHNLSKDLKNMLISSNNKGFIVTDDVVGFLANPKKSRQGLELGFGKVINKKLQFKYLDYDRKKLAREIRLCLGEDASEYINDDEPESPDAPILSLEQVQQQADDLGIELDDYRNCPCGEAFASVEMKSPPWVHDSLTLYSGLNRCMLRALVKRGEEGRTEVISAGGSGKSAPVNCWATMGLTSKNQRVKFRAKNEKYSHETLQSCYNIIEAKANQWLKQGGEINLILDPKNDPRKSKTLEATEDNLKCSAPN